MIKKEIVKSFVECLYETLDDVVSPTPFLSITKDNEDVRVRFLNGKGILPDKDSMEITVLDLDIAGLFLPDIPLLYEGGTGIGKTYTSDALFKTVFGRDGYCTIRLSSGVYGSSALEPFSSSFLDNGIPKTRIDEHKCRKYGALKIEEINRGDSQEILQLADGLVEINGGSCDIGLPVEGRVKKPVIIATMNPPSAMYRSALELDAAVENRFLKLKFPNGVDEAGSSQLDKRIPEGLHENFWSMVKSRTGLEGDWKSLYASITDFDLNSLSLDSVSREFIDIAVGYVDKSPLENFNRNAELIKKGGYNTVFSIDEGNELERIHSAQRSLKHAFTRRDLRKINDFSRLLAFTKSFKDGSYDPKISLNDVVAGIAFNLEGNNVSNTDFDQLMDVVIDLKESYDSLRKNINIPEGFGLRETFFQAAVNDGADAFSENINTNLDTINTVSSSISESAVKSRLMSDLVVLKNFVNNHESDVNEVLNSDNPLEEFIKLFCNKRSESSIYKTRLGFLR